MSTHKAEAFHWGTVDGHSDASHGRRRRRLFIAVRRKARDGRPLIKDAADASAYKSGYIRSYQDERESRRRRYWRRRRLGL